MVHLTNDAVQKKSEDYGKYENGNKVSFLDFQKFLETKCTSEVKINFQIDICNRMKELATQAVYAVYGNIDPYKYDNTFELFGLDFMIDAVGKVYLIEVNTNPCLEMSSPLLARLIPLVLENTFRFDKFALFIKQLRIAVDPIFPPPDLPHWAPSRKIQIPDNIIEHNKFELIFDEIVNGQELRNLFAKFKSERNDLRNVIETMDEESNEDDNEF